MSDSLSRYRERWEELQRFGRDPDRPEIEAWYRELVPGADEFHRTPRLEDGRRDVEESG